MGENALHVASVDTERKDMPGLKEPTILYIDEERCDVITTKSEFFPSVWVFESGQCDAVEVDGVCLERGHCGHGAKDAKICDARMPLATGTLRRVDLNAYVVIRPFSFCILIECDPSTMAAWRSRARGDGCKIKVGDAVRAIYLSLVVAQVLTVPR